MVWVLEEILYGVSVVGEGVCCIMFEVWVRYFINTSLVVCCHNNESGIFWFDIVVTQRCW